VTPGAVAVVIPAYNEARTIATVAEGARRHADVVIVVDDGSDDGTAAALAELPIEVVRHADNQGKAASLCTGMRSALALEPALVITMDGDGQHDPDDMPRLLAAAARLPGQIVLAARSHDRETAPPLRRFANAMADFWISWAAGQWIADTQSGYRLFPADVLRKVLPVCAGYHGFVFESAVLMEAAERGAKIATVPIRTLYPRDARPSYYRPSLDTLLIVRAVAWRLLRRGMAPLDLARALGWLRPTRS
jgi:glycosyltransferase involved in cell wall biosynthesis